MTRRSRPELLALRRARHPNLSAIADVDGESLAAAKVEAGAVERIAAQLLRGLSELHRRNLVHGRVCPSTVILGEGRARLTGFDQSDDDLESPFSAPELTRDRDPRSDLYSLGATLYFALAGSPPFDEVGPARLAQAKRTSPPRDLEQRAPAASEPLVALVETMLSPTPGARPATALEALASLGADTEDCRAVEPRPVFGAYLVGRDPLIGSLEEMWWDAKAGRGSVALITGPAGVGKSRILAEMCERVARAGGSVLRLDVAASPLWRTEVRAELDARFARHEAIVRAVAERTRGQPCAVVVDDAHCADPSRADTLQYLVRAAAASSQLWLLASGPVSPHADDPSQRLREAVVRAERGHHVELDPVGEGAVHDAIADAVGRQVADERSARAYAEHGGVLGEVARAIGQRDVHAALEELPATSRDALARLSILAPELDVDTGAGLLRGDANAVEEVLADGIEAGAVIGVPGTDRYRFRGEAVAALDALVPQLDRVELSARAVLVLAETGAPAERIADHAFAAGDDSATEWGLRAAESLAAECDHVGALRWYRRVLDALDDATQASAVRERIAELCMLVGDHAGAAEQLQSALDTATRPEQRTQLSCRMARARFGLGETSGAVEAAMTGLELARQHARPGAEIEAHRILATVLSASGDLQGALEHAVTGHLLASNHSDQAQVAELLRLRGRLESDRGEHAAGIEKLESAAAAADSVGDELLSARVLHDLGRAAVRAGNYPKAVDVLERATLSFERTSHVVRLLRSLNNLGAAYYFQGRWQRAREAWERFRRLCERTDERSELVTALNNLGSLYRDLGELSDSLSVLDRGTEIAAQRGDYEISAMLLGNRGEALAKRGDYAAAAECYARALSEFERLGAKQDAIETRRRMCELSLTTGRINDALDRVVDIARDARDAGTVLEEGILHRVAASALRCQGDLESAGWFADKADRLLSPLGARYELAKLRAERAAIAAAQSDRTVAEAELRAAIAEFDELGARWDVARCRASLRHISPAEHGGDGATPLLSELANAPARSSVDDLLASGLDRVLERTRFGRGFILLLDSDGRPEQRVRRTRPGSEAFEPGEAEFSGSIVKRVAATGESVAITDIDETEDDLADSSSVVALGLRQVMCAPMATRGRVIGTVYVDNRGDTPIDDSAPGLPILEAFAAEASVVVENSRLEDEVSRKTELMAMLAHEIRNPLAGILGFSEVGIQTSEDKNRELFQRIRRDGQRMRRLVDNVLELARHDAGKIDWLFEPVDMAELIAEVADSFGPTCESKKLQLDIDTAAATSHARASADRIAQVLSNLINNAVKFTPEGGRISIVARVESVTRNDPDAPPMPATAPAAWGPIEPTEIAGADYVRVDVSDSGPGMSEEIRANLFQKFRQGKRGKKSGKGVGLGLYISREIIVRHGGSIWASSVRGEGSTFSFRVPVATE